MKIVKGKLAFPMFTKMLNIFFATEPSFEFRPPFDFVDSY